MMENLKQNGYLNQEKRLKKEMEAVELVFLLKVSQFRKQISLFSFEPKNERNYFLISALKIENRSNQKIKGSVMLNTPYLI